MKKALTLLGGLLALVGAPGFAGAASTPMAPEAAPRAWVVYAEAATHSVSLWLNDETPPAPRVRAVLEQLHLGGDPQTPPLVLKLWIGRDGAITRAEFPPLSDAQADQDLHALLLARRLPSPPKGMRLPLRIALQLEPRPSGGAPEAPPAHR